MLVYHYLEAPWALEDIRKQWLKLSKIDDMNDPYEWGCVYSDHEPSQVALSETAHNTFEMYGVLCFSRSWNNILMWSHYGNRHKGMCLAFEVPDELTRIVDYVDDVSVVGSLGDLPTTDQAQLIDRLYGAKYEGWHYEEEVRIHGTRDELDDNAGMYFIKFSEKLKLRTIIVGSRCTIARTVIEDALIGYSEDVTIVKVTHDPRRFQLIATDY
jgi:hypothetical protein